MKSSCSYYKQTVFLRSYVELNLLKYALTQLPLKADYSVEHNEVFTIPGKTSAPLIVRS